MRASNMTCYVLLHTTCWQTVLFCYTCRSFMYLNQYLSVPVAARRRSAAVRLLKLWVRIPPATWMSVVSTVCCQLEVSATS